MADSELEKNIKVYNKMREQLIKHHSGKVALFSGGDYKDVYNDFSDAYKIGMQSYGEGNFSIKRIGEDTYSLGFIGLTLESANKSKKVAA